MEPLKRPRYFAGQLLTADDFTDEQNYHRRKERLRNGFLLGFGVVSGLEVTARPEGIFITPGYAIDALGREIFVTGPRVLPYPRSLHRCVIAAAYKETPADPVPVPGTTELEYSRIEEGYLLEAWPAGSVPEANVVLGALEHAAAGWRMVRRPSQRAFQIVAVALVGVALVLCTGKRR
jgi:hypothetical protein